MGLYGNIIVAPADPDYWSPVHRELALVLDDVLIEDGRIAPFSTTESNYVAMGRFGNVLLLNGEPDLSLDAQQGEVVRLYLTNTANTRVFNVGIPGARMKRVGGDSGRYEREEFVDGLILAPSERAVVDVCFDEAGELTLEHRTPDRTYPLAMIRVADEQVEPRSRRRFEVLPDSADMHRRTRRIAADLEAGPDKTLAFVAEMDMGRECRLRQRRRVGTHIGDVPALVQPLRDLHRAGGAEAELARGFLLHRRGAERGVRTARVGLGLDRANRERLVGERGGEGAGAAARRGATTLSEVSCTGVVEVACPRRCACRRR